MRARMRGKSGVTPILGTMMLLLIILTMVATVLWWGTPTIRALEVETQYASTKGYFENLNREVKNLMKDGWGCSRTFKMSFPSGSLQMYRDISPFIEREEVETQADFKPKTVWVVSYNTPNSQYDLLFEDIIDERTDKFTIRRLDSAAPLPSCRVMAHCLEGERKGETTSFVTNIDASGASVNIDLYDVTYISVESNSKEVIAGAYVFSIAPINYRYPTGSGTFHLTQMGTGLTTNYPESPSVVQPLLQSESSISGSEKTITLYMTDFVPRGVYQTGSGDYDLRMRFGDVGYYGNQYVKDLRVTVDGEYQEAWIKSLSERFTRAHQSTTTYTGFIRDDAQVQKGVIYNTRTSVFSEHQNLVMLNLIWARVDVEIGS